MDKNLYQILHISNDPYLKWLKSTLHADAKVGYDSRLQPANWEQSTAKSLAGHITLISIDANPIDLAKSLPSKADVSVN